MSHSKSCILAHICRAVDTGTCNGICQFWIAMHGDKGMSGRIGATGIPSDYRLVTAQTSPVRESQPEVYTSIDAYVKTFQRQFMTPPERVKSLYLYSESPGTGKTTTACAVANEWVIRHYLGSLQKGDRPDERPAFFLDVNEWQTLYNTFNRPKVPDSIGEPAAEKYYKWMQLAHETPFVVLDDIGVRSPTDGFRADLHAIVNARVTNQLPTIYTSNVDLSELEAVFGERRLADRVRDMCIQLNFKGESKRGRR